ncbi:class I SAM-dependent RNA methyltransferase [Plantactinospora siamensis]|uniref:Class I SAM-dependent RNA methyltransferase n=1 Tax=Plantactinospora siamensis TaxID=555372 RepID=A0ABV6NSL9_9ACTN
MTVEEAERIEVTVGAPAHGGHCVARHEGQVVFVRHALPGERVIAEVTETHRGFARADAVEVLEAAAERVEPPCPYARPGRCGGCDLQHVAPDAQREWKSTVLREQLERLGGLEPTELAALDLTVRALPGGPLGWRSRVRYAVDAADRAGLRKHRSHEVVPIDRCLIAHPTLQELPVLASSGRRWPDADEVTTVVSSGGDVAVRELGRGGTRTVDGPETVAETAAGRDWRLPADAFWQVHPAAADTLTTAVLELLRPAPGETAWDLYGGVGLFAGALAGPLADGGRVTVVEADPELVAAARANLADLAGVEVVQAPVERALRRRRIAGPVDLVVLDPPRSGAGREVTEAVAGSGARAVAYVACDPAAFARDVRTFRAGGWRLAEIRGFDLFPMTQHLECVGLLLPG